ncbi:hypothetical protein GGQ60_000759 [Pedobacter zeae]|uniref:Uncharacterized protein n=1 Tax=Pedobacter zeae TaxID=1737356 RepID=A0A7W6K7X1_9SPHI|nr:hypothetical protein [Pedobacter zeae]
MNPSLIKPNEGFVFSLSPQHSGAPARCRQGKDPPHGKFYRLASVAPAT